ncbi:hypothetical protein FPV67DRAFT_1460853 [Lyophyllum atratum]|nr:hypothetical protein FPV67DRAFT_1460853 [Lyophyllum atratum]
MSPPKHLTTATENEPPPRVAFPQIIELAEPDNEDRWPNSDRYWMEMAPSLPPLHSSGADSLGTPVHLLDDNAEIPALLSVASSTLAETTEGKAPSRVDLSGPCKRMVVQNSAQLPPHSAEDDVVFTSPPDDLNLTTPVADVTLPVSTAATTPVPHVLGGSPPLSTMKRSTKGLWYTVGPHVRHVRCRSLPTRGNQYLDTKGPAMFTIRLMTKW